MSMAFEKTIRGTIVTGGADIACLVILDWSALDPAAVHMTFSTEGHEPTRWVVARELLWAAVLPGNEAAGQGDMTFARDGVRLYLYISSPEGDADMWVLASEVAGFLDVTVAALPIDSEKESRIVLGQVDKFLAEVFA